MSDGSVHRSRAYRKTDLFGWSSEAKRCVDLDVRLTGERRSGPHAVKSPRRERSAAVLLVSASIRPAIKRISIRNALREQGRHCAEQLDQEER
jgi:hypothetical protein